MAAQTVRQHTLSAWCALGLLVLILLPAAGVAQDTTFLTGEELAAKVRHNLVWIAAQDIGEHGYGLVVGADDKTVWVVTARHVVVRTAMRGSTQPEQPSRDIQLRWCTDPAGALQRAQTWPAFDAGSSDLALLSLPRPVGFTVLSRALASVPAVVGEPVWLLGSNDDCALVPAQGQVRAAADAAHQLRIDFPGVQGGSSGAPVLGGQGVLGLMLSAEDVTATVLDIQHVQRRLSVLAGVPWQLVAALNIPPTDPRAAETDLAETLNQYLLVLNNVHMLLQQRQVARPTLESYTARYNTALQRFLRVRETYDGTLGRLWPQPVLPAWRRLRDTLWAVHQTFWRINPLMAEVFTEQRSTPALREQMVALQPQLQRLESDTAQFLRMLSKEP